MSKYLYEAAILQLRGKALEAYATLELLFKNPTAVPDHSAWAEEIIKHTKILAQNENAMITLQQHFGKHFNPQQPPVPPHAPAPIAAPQSTEEPLAMTPEKSPLVRRELHRQKMAEAAKARRERQPPKELYPPTEEESGLKEPAPKKKRSRKVSQKAEEKPSDVE
tara:strand:- start:104 stop:598 length:495 start_codon:yes stop_codon:yes gene_type:complete